jgi:hypothetical protein
MEAKEANGVKTEANTDGAEGGGEDNNGEQREETEEGGGEDEDDEDTPISDNRNVTFQVRDLNNHLVCRLCDGYFRDAHTVTECLHTFCKSCLLVAFSEGNNACPHCKQYLGPNPRSMIISDRTLQELVNKIFPELQEKDEADERAFYEERGIELKQQHSEAQERSAAASSGPAKKKTKRSRDASLQSDSEISFKLAPDTSANTSEEMVLQPLEKPFLRTSGKLKVEHLQKYLKKKLKLGDKKMVEISCKGAMLGPELSLHFILKTRWHDTSSDLVLNYRKAENPEMD